MSLNDEDRAWISAQFGEFAVTVAERIERVETTLLTEFHKWASPVEMRIKTHTATLRAIDVELENVSDRVTRLEQQRPS
ncbi:MAG TPA: hypothetical protein VHZ25_03975 [Acidobacteriaceae bacterium]|jgi:hypothetical protein|nr:hypothetical protein [Acidobacteriaceae bacterium]